MAKPARQLDLQTVLNVAETNNQKFDTVLEKFDTVVEGMNDLKNAFESSAKIAQSATPLAGTAQPASQVDLQAVLHVLETNSRKMDSLQELAEATNKKIEENNKKIEANNDELKNVNKNVCTVAETTLHIADFIKWAIGTIAAACSGALYTLAMLGTESLIKSLATSLKVKAATFTSARDALIGFSMLFLMGAVHAFSSLWRYDRSKLIAIIDKTSASGQKS